MMKYAPLLWLKKATGIGISLFCTGLYLFGLQACASVDTPPKEEFQITLLEKQISEMDKKLDEIYHRVSIIQFMVDNHERKLKDLEKTKKQDSNTPGTGNPLPMEEPASDLSPPGLIQEAPLAAIDQPAPAPEPAAPTTAEAPEDLYNKALTAYKKGKFDTALSLFSTFSDKYPQHDLADNALYWAGECHYSRKNFSAAIISFKKVVTRYPEGSKVPDAFLKTGYAYLSMGDKENGRKFLTKVIKNFPFSPAGSKAEEMIKRLQ